MSTSLADLIAKRFIARRDIKAIQHSDGSFAPHVRRDKDGNEVERYPWRRSDLESHLAKQRTFGHYLLNEDNKCKLFAFDIDLDKSGSYPSGWDTSFKHDDSNDIVTVPDLRAAWLDRKHPGRSWFKYQLKMTAAKIARAIHDELDLECAVAYSGGKGLHVYGFTGLMNAEDVLEGALIVLDSLDEWEPSRGKVFFKHKNSDPLLGYPNLTVEVFPKQTTLDGKQLGNLMRLPLGRNLKSNDPTFFVDMTSPMGEMVPMDPVLALEGNTLWRKIGE